MSEHPANLDDLVECYLEGQLSPEEQEAWENHYFTCDECSLVLKQALAVRKYLERFPPELSHRHSSWPARLARAIRSRLRPTDFVLATACALALVVAGRGVLVQRAQQSRIAVLEAPRRVVDRQVVALPRSGSDAPVVHVSAAEGNGTLLVFYLPAPAAGKVAFHLSLEDPSGRIVWRDTLAAEGDVTAVSLVLGGPRTAPGRYRLLVESGHEHSTIPFTVARDDPRQSALPTSTNPDQ